MNIYRSLDALPPALQGGAVSIGNFDGVHRGHSQLIARLLEQARRVDGPALVFTFEPHPAAILRPEFVPTPLTTTEQKAELLRQQGVDALIAYPTTRELLNLSADDFFERVVREQLGAKAMVEGPNFFFGRDRQGTIERLRLLCELAGIELEIVGAQLEQGDYVSSSRIRKLIEAGDVASANAMLGHSLTVLGIVESGAQRGRELGFPTANVEKVATLLPLPGVYAGRAILDGTPWPAAINVGPAPTFGEARCRLEAHLIAFSGDLYGRTLAIEFVSRIRPVRQFDGVEQLREQLTKDVVESQRILDAN